MNHCIKILFKSMSLNVQSSHVSIPNQIVYLIKLTSILILSDYVLYVELQSLSNFYLWHLLQLQYLLLSTHVHDFWCFIHMRIWIAFEFQSINWCVNNVDILVTQQCAWSVVWCTNLFIHLGLLKHTFTYPKTDASLHFIYIDLQLLWQLICT